MPWTSHQGILEENMRLSPKHKSTYNSRSKTMQWTHATMPCSYTCCNATLKAWCNIVDTWSQSHLISISLHQKPSLASQSWQFPSRANMRCQNYNQDNAKDKWKHVMQHVEKTNLSMLHKPWPNHLTHTSHTYMSNTYLIFAATYQALEPLHNPEPWCQEQVHQNHGKDMNKWP